MFPLLVVAWLCGLPISLPAATVERTNWVWEQLSTRPFLTRGPKRRYGIVLDSQQFDRAFSSSARATIDFGLAEVRLGAGRRYFFGQESDNPLIRPALRQEQSHLSVQIGRYFVDSKTNYGRFSLGYFQFFPESARRYWNLAMETGVLARDDPPWELHIGGQVFFPAHGGESYFSLRVLMARAMSTQLKMVRVGLLGHATMRIYSGNKALGRFESILLTAGPTLLWQTTIGDLSFQLRWRYLIDKERENTTGAVLTKTLTEFDAAPDLALRWSVAF